MPGPNGSPTAGSSISWPPAIPSRALCFWDPWMEVPRGMCCGIAPGLRLSRPINFCLSATESCSPRSGIRDAPRITTRPRPLPPGQHLHHRTIRLLRFGQRSACLPRHALSRVPAVGRLWPGWPQVALRWRPWPLHASYPLPRRADRSPNRHHDFGFAQRNADLAHAVELRGDFAP